MTAMIEETSHALALIEQVEELESIADTMDTSDDRRARLLRLAQRALADAQPLRPAIAAQILMLSEKTIRAWTHEGVLIQAETTSPRLVLDPVRVHQVRHLLTDLRAAGKTTGLLDEVHRRLVDATWLERADLVESLEQMRRGEGIREELSAQPA